MGSMNIYESPKKKIRMPKINNLQKSVDFKRKVQQKYRNNKTLDVLLLQKSYQPTTTKARSRYLPLI